MIKIKSYGSGSKGNLYLVSNANTNIILECGLEIDVINKMLNLNNLKYSDINACFTSHHHSDHSMSIKHFNDYDIPCYCTYDTKLKFDINEQNFNQLIDNRVYKIGSIQVMTLSVNHGQTNCFGFIFKDKDNMILFITDFMQCIKNLKPFAFNEIFIECNYLESEWEYKKSLNDENEELMKKYKRQLNTHQSLGNLVIHLKNMNLTKCDKITLIHISQDLGNYDIMIDTIEQEFGIECIALLPNGKEY